MDDYGRDEWAAAVALALALLDHAAARHRPFALITFTGRIVGETIVQPGGSLPWEALTVPSEGSTNISLAVSRGSTSSQRPTPVPEGRHRPRHRRRRRP